MSVPSDSTWTATITLQPASPEWSRWLEESLRPEAAREVPRARATLRLVPPHGLALDIEARDVGALRAALNTYLGWLQLALGTLRAAGASGASPPRAP